MNLAKKETAVAELKGQLSGASAAFVVEYHGCTCEELTALRRKLRPVGASFSVVKNTIAKRAIADTEVSRLEEFLYGPTALIVANDDPVSPAKFISEFAKEREVFVIKAGVVDGEVVDSQGIKALATLPSKEELLGKLLGLINAPATKLLQTINAPASQVVRLLGAWKDEIETKSQS